MRNLLIRLACLAAACSGLRGADLYVAPNGRDVWSGQRPDPAPGETDGPFATLERARDEIRRRRATSPEAFTVHVRAGRYVLERTLQLDGRDSGSASAPVVWRGYQDERPLILGGRPIAGFTRHEGRILKAEVGAQGFKGVYFRMLLCDGRQQVLARYPNFDPQNPYGGGFAYVEGKVVPMYADIPGEDKRTLHYAPADDRAWSRPTEAEVMIFPRYNWWNNVVRVAARDRETRTLTLAADCSYAIRPADRYYVRNVREELDAPGEWYLERDTATLYFWPPEGADLSTVVAPTLRTLVELGKGTAHVTLRGFVFEGCEGTAIHFTDTTDCRVVASTVRNVGDYRGHGVQIDGGRNNGVIGCDLHHIGAAAILLSGGDQRTLTPAGISPRTTTSTTRA